MPLHQHLCKFGELKPMTTRWRELRPIAQHASTVFVGQLALVVSGITDTIIVGQYSPHALAALSVGSALYVSVFVGLLGVLQALLPVWAELGQNPRQSLVWPASWSKLRACLPV